MSSDDSSDEERSSGTTQRGDILAPSPLLTLGAFLVGIGIEQMVPSGLFPWVWNLGVGVPLIAGGCVLFGGALWTMRDRGKHPSHSDEPRELIKEGVFRFSRNPIYAGHSLIHVGGSFLIDSVWPLVTLVPLLIYLRTVVLREESDLETLFGEEYDRYRQNVRRWL